jgi:hypothetical protein
MTGQTLRPSSAAPRTSCLPYLFASLAFGGAMAASSPSSAVQPRFNNCACKPGYVQRLADDKDYVCVTQQSRDLIKNENATIKIVVRNGISYCAPGTVWRDAYDGDGRCVIPSVRDRVHAENSQHVRNAQDAACARTGSTAPGAFSSKIVQYAINHIGQRLGNGECTELVIDALADAGAPPGDTSSTTGDYKWGTAIDFPLVPAQPGDIVQLVNVKLTGPNGWWETTTQHSAIIESVTGTVLHVIDQNAPPGNPVGREDIDLGWKLERGKWTIYRAGQWPGFAKRPKTVSHAVGLQEGRGTVGHVKR